MQPTRIDVLTTASGTWNLDFLGIVGDVAAYQWTHAGSNGTRVMLCRDPQVGPPGSTSPLQLATVQVQIGSLAVSTSVAPGACRIVEDQPLVQPNPAWVINAVKAGRIPVYTRARSWVPVNPQPIAPLAPYDPGVLGRAPGQTAAAFNGWNFVGVTSAEGGEHISSRGFVHAVDAQVVDLALNGPAVGDWPTVVRYSWESLAQPGGAVWSKINHTTVDPQKPQTGDEAWATVGIIPGGDALSVRFVDGWGRDVAHLENTCYVHWLATEDPVAGMCVQRQLAFALSQYGENLRLRTPGTYGVVTDQPRSIFNAISTLWKASDVANHVTSQTGHVIWGADRLNPMVNEVFKFLDPIVAPAPSADYAQETQRLSNTLAGGLQVGFFQTNGSTPVVTSTSNFMLAQYGKESLYLWARSGNALAKKWLTIAAYHMAARLQILGAGRGVDQCSPLKGIPTGFNEDIVRKSDAGSNLPVGVATLSGSNIIYGKPQWRDVNGWAQWAASLCPGGATDRFDGSAFHSATQSEGLLLLAKGAGVPGLDSAIAAVQAAKAKTNMKLLRYGALNWPKHWAAPIEGYTGH